MSENLIRSLNNVAQKIYDLLGEFQRQIMEALNYLKVLPDLISQVLHSINEGFNRQIQSQGEMEIFIRMANIKSKYGLIASEKQRIEDFKNHLDEDYGEISRRYEKLLKELDNQAESRVQKVDEHLFSLNDLFPMRLYTAITKEYEPLLKYLRADVDESYIQRYSIINKYVDDSKQQIGEFLRKRIEYFKKLEKYSLEATDEEISTYYLPVLIIEIQDTETGETQFYRYLPGQNAYQKGPYDDVNIDSTRLSQVLDKKVNWGPNHKYKNKLLNRLNNKIERNYKKEFLSNPIRAVQDCIRESDVNTVQEVHNEKN